MTNQGSHKNEDNLVAKLYDRHLERDRSSFEARCGFRNSTDPSADPKALTKFLISFCSLGIQMTLPVDRWIRSAGKRCHEVGLDALGDALTRHAEHEAGHHRLMVDDTRVLTALYNHRFGEDIDAEELVNRAPTQGVSQYVELHERYIYGGQPYGQLAIELEIESLSVRCGPKVISNIAVVCGAEVVEGLSFLTDHIAVDQAHTAFNRRQLSGLLGEHPEFGPALVTAGSEALDAYGAFLDDCWSDAVRA